MFEDDEKRPFLTSKDSFNAVLLTFDEDNDFTQLFDLFFVR